MEDFGQLNPEEIKMRHLSILNGQIVCPEEHENEKVHNFKFDVEFKIGHNLIDGVVKTDFHCFVTTESIQQKEANGAFHISYWFSVENLADLIKVENKQEQISPSLANALAAITYSTTRGILMCRFQGTALSNFILPIIDPNELLK